MLDVEGRLNLAEAMNWLGLVDENIAKCQRSLPRPYEKSQPDAIHYYTRMNLNEKANFQ